jgi:hypothetical protein
MTRRNTSEELVRVYICHNPAELPVVESLLIEAGIRYLVKGAELQGLIGGGQTGGTNLVAPLELCVFPQDAEATRALLGSPVAAPSEEPGV